MLYQTKGPRIIAPRRRGWTANRFAAEGERLIRNLFGSARVTTRVAEAQTAKKLYAVYADLADRLANIIGKKSAKAPIGDLWSRAIEEELQAAGFDAAAIIQGTATELAQISRDVTFRLLDLEDRGLRASVALNSGELARRITQINETTRHNVRRLLQQAIERSDTVKEVADALRGRMRTWAENRVRTVARTETMLAWNEATAKSMQASSVVTHVSVIGCESREEERWGSPSYQQFMYEGESTCNIRDVPVEDADKLRFHPNHTGCMVPSRMEDDEAEGGSVDIMELNRPTYDPRPDFAEVDDSVASLSATAAIGLGEKLEPYLDTWAGQWGLDKDTYKEALGRRMATVTGQMSLATTLPNQTALGQWLSAGLATSAIRPDKVSATVAEIYGMKPGQHWPVIASLTTAQAGPETASKAAVQIHWKDSVRPHTTVLTAPANRFVATRGSRLERFAAASPINQPQWLSAVGTGEIDPMETILAATQKPNLAIGWEAQIARQVTAEDIDLVVIKLQQGAGQPDSDLLELLRKFGIKYRVEYV